MQARAHACMTNVLTCMLARMHTRAHVGARALVGAHTVPYPRTSTHIGIVKTPHTCMHTPRTRPLVWLCTLVWHIMRACRDACCMQPVPCTHSWHMPGGPARVQHIRLWQHISYGNILIMAAFVAHARWTSESSTSTMIRSTAITMQAITIQAIIT